MERYFGTYQTFQTVSRKEAAVLMGADNLVGDRFSIDCSIEDGVQKAWLVNKFDQRVGYFDPAFSRQLSIMKAQGMTLLGLLSFIAYTDNPDPGFYWGEAAVIAYDPQYQGDFDPFIDSIAEMMKTGSRPAVNLQSSAVDKVLQSHGSWTPKDTVPLPQLKKGTALVKTKQSITDRLVEEGRKKNKGCYVLSWAFIIAFIALILFWVKSCGLIP